MFAVVPVVAPKVNVRAPWIAVPEDGERRSSSRFGIARYRNRSGEGTGGRRQET